MTRDSHIMMKASNSTVSSQIVFSILFVELTTRFTIHHAQLDLTSHDIVWRFNELGELLTRRTRKLSVNPRLLCYGDIHDFHPPAWVNQ